MIDNGNAGSFDVRSDGRASATQVSLLCDTGSSNNKSSINNCLPSDVPLREIEVESAALRAARTRQAGRFLKGPIPLRDIAAAARLPGRALAVFLAVHHRVALTRNPVVALPKRLLTELGVTRDGKARALNALEAAGIVRVERQRGRQPKIKLSTQHKR